MCSSDLSCGNLDSRDPCAICADAGRERGLVCVVESVGDLWEKAQKLASFKDKDEEGPAR